LEQRRIIHGVSRDIRLFFYAFTIRLIFSPLALSYMGFVFKPKLNIESLVPRGLLDFMHEKALTILEEVGIKVANKTLLRRIEGHERFKIEEGWIRIRSDLIEDLIAENRQKQKYRQCKEDEELFISLGYPGCSWIIDVETGHVEPLTTSRLIDATKFIDSLHDYGVRGGAPGAPVDVHPRLRRILQCLIGYTFSRSAGPAPFESYEEAFYIKRMAEVMEQPFGVDIYVVSPLRLEGISLDRAVPFLEKKDCAWFSVSSMPLAGFTAPVYPIGAFIQGICESVGGYAILHEAYPDISASFSIGAYHCDIRHGNIVFGSPEQTLMDLFGVALNMFYGKTLYGVRSFRTMAKNIDLEAQIEKVSSATVGVLTGPGAFIHAGLLSVDEIFSPIQLVIDCELARYLMRLTKGLEFTEEEINLSIDAILRCAKKGHYLMDKTTLLDYRRIYWIPEILDYSLFHTHRPSPDIIERAKKIYKEKMKEHEYVLEETKRKKLEEIHKEAEKNLL